MIIPNTYGSICVTVNYNKMNSISSLSHTPLPPVNDVLDSFRKGRIFSSFDLVSSFLEITAHEDIIPLIAFFIPTQLYEWLVMPRQERHPRIDCSGYQRG